jgi:hypothetical protein
MDSESTLIRVSRKLKRELDLLKTLGKYSTYEDIIWDSFHDMLEMAYDKHADYIRFKNSVTVGITNDEPTVFEKSMRSEVE